jgi:peptidoglycan/LPS O-acetylase OafA/YrhL
MTTIRLRSLDGLRGLLAIYILLGHSMPFLPPAPWLVPVAHAMLHGRAAVDVFFILSGMVIVRSLRRWQGQRPGQRVAAAFLRARAARLLPVYLVALATACLALSLGNPYDALPWLDSTVAHDIVAPGWPDQVAAQIAAHLTMTQGLLPPAILPGAEFALLGPAWSLSTEWQFYAGLALVLIRWQPRPEWLVALLLILAVLGRALCLLPPDWQLGRAFLPVEAGYFALGIASDALLSEGTGSPRLFIVALAGCMALALSDGGVDKLGAPLIWLLCLTSLRRGTLVGQLAHRLLCLPPLLWLGAISYPLYLIHAPLQRALMLAAAPLAGGDPWRFAMLWWPSAILLPLLAAWLLHRWVERPSQAWGKRPAPAIALMGGA